MTTGTIDSSGGNSNAVTEEEFAAFKEFAAMLGAAVFSAGQLQLRLAHLYAITFDSPEHASRPRVTEKRQTALALSFGAAVQLAKENGSISGDLLHEVEFAVELRDYIVHRLFLGTRGQHNPAGFPELTSRLYVAMDLFKLVERHVYEKYEQTMRAHLAFRGLAQEIFDASQRPWDELEDEEVEPYPHRPAKREEIVRAWTMPSDSGPKLVLENAAGKFWQIVDIGLAHLDEVRETSWVEEALIQEHLPAHVKARPSSASNPPELRASFDYDLHFESGVALRILPKDAAAKYYEIITLRGK